MSLPTRIYLGVCAVAFAVWLGFIVGTERSAPPYASDPSYFVAHASELTETLYGRVVYDAPSGADEGVPEGALVVRVRGVDLDRRIAVERTAPVDTGGAFEVRGLPLGTAEVAVLLGGATALATVEDVLVDDSRWRLDPRVDPIDLGGLVAPFEVVLQGPAALGALEGHLAWRPAAPTLDAGAPGFEGLAFVRDGRARFLSTTDHVDVVPLVPGIRRDVEPWVASGDAIRVGPGAILDLAVDGPRPDPATWRVLAHLEPVASAAEDLGALLGGAATSVPRHATGALDEEGRARIPLVAGGRHALRWYVSREGVRITNTVRIEDPEGPLEIAHTGGVQAASRAFPMDEFLARLSARE